MAGGGAAPPPPPPPPPKQDELHPAGVSYCITNPPPWREAILLGFQHYIVMLGTTVLIPSFLVPQMGGGKEEKALMIQTLQFVTGLNTLNQTLFGTRLPSVIGGSYTFIPATLSIILGSRYGSTFDPHEKFTNIMTRIQGAMIVASTVQVVLGFSGLCRNMTRFMSPLSTVPLVALTGFGIYELRLPLLTGCVEIELPQLTLLVIFSQYLPHVTKGRRTVFSRFCLVFSLAIIWMYAHLVIAVGGDAYKNAPFATQLSCTTDKAAFISAAPWIRVPYPFQWGAPTFNGGESFVVMATSFVALVESTGAFVTVSRYASATPMPHSVLSRGVGWQGVGILLSGIFGTGTGSTVSIENAGLLGLTRVRSRRVIKISAAFMIFFSIVGKFGAVFASIPAPIVAALYCLVYVYVGVGGLGFLRYCNFNRFRTIFITAFSILMGLSVLQYFNDYLSVKKPGPVHTNARRSNAPFSLKAFVSITLALVLDVTLLPAARGKQWWDKFRCYKTDTRE